MDTHGERQPKVSLLEDQHRTGQDGAARDAPTDFWASAESIASSTKILSRFCTIQSWMYRDPCLRIWQLEGGQLASLLHHLIFKASPNNFYKPTCCATFSFCSCSTAWRFESGIPGQDEVLPLHSPRPECVRCCSASTTDITCWSF